MLPKLPRLRARASRNGVRYYFDRGADPNTGRRRWESLGSDEAAVMRRYQALIDEPQPVRGTVDAMLADCLESLRGKVRPSTLKLYRGWRKHLAAVFRHPQDVTQADVVRYMRAAAKHRLTFRGEISLLSQAFVGWMDAGRVEFNPCFGVRVKGLPRAKRKRLLLAGEIEAIIGKAPERIALAIELAYATGLRISDLCALRWADVAGVFETRKTSQRTTIDDSAGALETLLARARTRQAKVGSLYVLCDRRGRPWKSDTLRHHWITATVAAGVQDARFHDLRAAAATEVARQFGEDAAREFLGHRTVVTTRTYLRDFAPAILRPLRRKA